MDKYGKHSPVDFGNGSYSRLKCACGHTRRNHQLGEKCGFEGCECIKFDERKAEKSTK